MGLGVVVPQLAFQPETEVCQHPLEMGVCRHQSLGNWVLEGNQLNPGGVPAQPIPMGIPAPPLQPPVFPAPPLYPAPPPPFPFQPPYSPIPGVSTIAQDSDAPLLAGLPNSPKTLPGAREQPWLPPLQDVSTRLGNPCPPAGAP
uniref:Uncharacterized protein n=1 Tax=Sphaerodactylus townsendi TaxID=933632 RepID=A0ACB8EU72_9SAUR